MTEDGSPYMEELFPAPRPRVESLFLYDRRFWGQVKKDLQKIKDKKEKDSNYVNNGLGI